MFFLKILVKLTTLSAKIAPTVPQCRANGAHIGQSRPDSCLEGKIASSISSCSLFAGKRNVNRFLWETLLPYFPNAPAEIESIRKRRRSNPSGKGSQERLTRGTVASTICRAAHPSGCARCVAGAGCSAKENQPLKRVPGFRSR